MTLADRFWAKVDRRGPDECWLWTASVNSSGYGRIGLGKRGQGSISAHRLSYELANGPIPDGEGYHGTCVLHRCDTPACVNPAHLFLGTQADNLTDAAEKGRMHPGEAHGMARLTESQIREIRRLYKPYVVPRRVLAERFGVADTTIQAIIEQRSWAHV